MFAEGIHETMTKEIKSKGVDDSQYKNLKIEIERQKNILNAMMETLNYYDNLRD